MRERQRAKNNLTIILLIKIILFSKIFIENSLMMVLLIKNISF